MKKVKIIQIIANSCKIWKNPNILKKRFADSEDEYVYDLKQNLEYFAGVGELGNFKYGQYIFEI